jgi:hypothetical protein
MLLKISLSKNETKRIDIYLSNFFSDKSRSYIQRLIDT